VRDRSSFETLVRNATFLALSLFIHVLVILGNRPLSEALPEVSVAAERP
jgi:hypothetical protein